MLIKTWGYIHSRSREPISYQIQNFLTQNLGVMVYHWLVVRSAYLDIRESPVLPIYVDRLKKLVENISECKQNLRVITHEKQHFYFGLKSVQNKKGQKILGHPTKKQSFYKEKRLLFCWVPQIFLALLILNKL